MTTYGLTGSGSAMVFLHAGIGDRRMWHPQVSRFSTSHLVLTVDSPGFGENPLPAEPFSRSELVIELMDDLDIRDAVLVGASMGGRVALEVAIERPDLVRALVLIASALPAHDWSTDVHEVWRAEDDALDTEDIELAVRVNLDFWLDGPKRSAANISAADRALVADMQHQAFEHDLAATEPLPERSLNDLAGRLSEIAIPTAVLYGDEDAADIAIIANRLADSIPNATLHVISGTAHLPSLEAPDLVNPIIAELLADAI